MAWNIQKDKKVIYEAWRPYLKYIWLIIYKFIFEKIESYQCNNEKIYYLY